MTLEEYIASKHTQSSTISYLRSIRAYLEWAPHAATAQRQTILQYLSHLRQNQRESSVAAALTGIKKYYDYLQWSGQRLDHPVKGLIYRGKPKTSRVVQGELLSDAQRWALWAYYSKKKWRLSGIHHRNLSAIGLFLFQGLEPIEMRLLQLHAIDWTRGTITIPATGQRNARTLELLGAQILPLSNYIYQERPKLSPNNDALFISRKGKAMQHFHHLLKDGKQVVGSPINIQMLRSSLLKSWFDSGKSLSEVQYRSGHRRSMSAARYNVKGLDQLRASIEVHHPLYNGLFFPHKRTLLRLSKSSLKLGGLN